MNIINQGIIMVKKLYPLLGFFLLLGLMNCSATKVYVATYEAPRKNLESFKTFSIARINAEDPQIEREILKQVRSRLEAKGLHYVNSNADFLIAVQFYTGTYEEYIPPTTLRMRDFSPDKTGQRERDRQNLGERRTQADIMRAEVRKKTKTFEGYTHTGYYQNIQVYFVQLPDKKTMEIVWQGAADTMTDENNLLTIAPFLIDELMSEFPHKSGKPTARKISMR